MHQKSQEDEPMTDGEQGSESRTRTANAQLTDGEQWSESRTRTANAQLTAGNTKSHRNGEPNREFDAVDHHITVSQVSMDHKCINYHFYSHNASKVPRR